MPDRKRVSIAVTSVLLIVGVVALMHGLFTPVTSPFLAFHDGLPVEIVNCEAPPPDAAYRCPALYCEKALYDRKLVRPYTRVAIPKHHHKFSDAPDRSVHFATWTHEDRPVVAKCEMKRFEVVSIEFLERMPQ